MKCDIEMSCRKLSKYPCNRISAFLAMIESYNFSMIKRTNNDLGTRWQITLRFKFHPYRV